MKILLLEDDIALNRAIKKVTQLDGHETTSFVDGEDVYSSLDDFYDLYILDINVPNINGLELLKLIYEKNDNSKVIMISANTDIDSLKKAYEFGCIDYLKKPFHLEELRIKIAKEVTSSEVLLQSVSLKDETTLTKKEELFLRLLLSSGQNVMSYEAIENSVYEGNYMSMDSLRALVKRLRFKLKDSRIDNVLEQGYRLSI
ncbi:response regulator transcription factor [Sulfurimonas sp. SAG-AH-194-L11]|nr:response regulator transcription factor [Sulfurimonas sp. SAG-AH-194-L11]MDF1876739.1 response regulator transcription factor [Sulfurimonas sp. SAG-AH-194-L11]